MPSGWFPRYSSCLSAMAFSFAAPAQEKVALALHLDKGDVFRFLCSSSITESTVLPKELDPAQEEIRETTAQEMDALYRVVSCGENGTIQLASSIKGLRAKVKPVPFGHKDLEFDSKVASTTAPDNAVPKMMAAALAKTIEVSLDATGKVIVVHGATELMRAALECLPNDPDQALAREMMIQMYTDENMRATLGPVFASLPRDPVGLGDTWTVAIDIPTETSWTLTYHVKSISDESVDVTIDGARDIPVGQSSAAAKNQPVQSADGGLHDHDKWIIDMMARMKIEGSGTGTARFSRKDGLPLQQTMTMTTTSSFPVPGGGDPAKITETITSSFERLPTDEGK